MALGDGIRRNVASISQEERNRLRDAILLLDTVKFYPDGSSHWDKQDAIHQATHVHGGPQFLPWHRELCNRFEALLRKADPALSLHYWDWTTDPRSTGGMNLFTSQFMGSAAGPAGSPFENFAITRDVNSGNPGAPAIDSDQQIVTTGDALPNDQQFPAMRGALEGNHGTSHGYIGGTIGFGHTAFEDPFVFLLHSNVDRLFAKWQLASGENWRLKAAQVYGAEGNTGGAAGITTPMEPWAGGSGLRPWAPPENQTVSKTSKHPSVVWPPLYDAGTQHDWRWCKKCECLAFAGHATPGKCAAGGKHNHSESGNYALIHNAPGVPGQDNWRWCKKCECLAFAGHPQPGKCPAGGKHNHSESGNYTLLNNAPQAPGQKNWRWCKKCECLAFAGHATPGKCPAGGTHDHSGSGNYTLMQMAPDVRQHDWRWCMKCQGLAFGGHATPGKCPAGGTHDHSGSGDYSLFHNFSGIPGQKKWRWCKKCEGLAFGGHATPGKCPAGGKHNHSESGNYTLLHNVPFAPGQHNWRWCKKCEGLAFGKNVATSNCPAGGLHDHSTSGDYSLLAH